MRSLPVSVLCTVFFSACATPESHSSGLDRSRDCGDSAVLALLNDSDTTSADLRDIGLRTNAAQNIITARDSGTVFNDIGDVDDVPYVGPAALAVLADHGAALCSAPACGEPEIVSFVNDPATTASTLKGVGVYSRGANNIVALRDGDDGTPGTSDDLLFDSLSQIDRVSYVGDSSIAALEAWGAQRCAATVVFSPQSYSDSHLISTESAIDAASARLDVAMYSFSDTTMLDAIEAAVDRGVSVRVIYHGAAEDRKDPAGTRSADLEDLGVEVRWTNKIMHHKFALIDGPRDSVDDAAGTVLVTGSANWSYSAATKYDENTLTIRDDARLALLYQREFNHLWDHSRPVEWNEDIADISHTAISDADIAAADGADASFTSANMRTYTSSRYGETFARDGDEWSVAEELAALIRGADTSVWVASGHMRARPVYEALIDVADDVDVRVYLDGQEYTSAWYYGTQLDKYDDCIASGDDDCGEQGLHFGYGLHDAGIPIRYKYYAYRWDYRYAKQMHHKYLLIDGDTLVTGSYNLSPNAEFDTLENITILSAARYPAVVADYATNFETLWDTNRDGTLDTLHDEITDGTDNIPLVFDAMALTWDEVDGLKDAIRDACAAVDSEDYRDDPHNHTTCPRD